MRNLNKDNMKNLEFRAWHIKEKRYEYFTLEDAQGYNGDYTISNASLGDVDVDDLINGLYIIERFTGLKDKNGEKIFTRNIEPTETNIKTLRAILKMTQTEFAELLGTTQITVSAWENGKCPDYIERLAKMALK